MNFLFVIPKYINAEGYYEMPLGIASVAAYLKLKGFNIFCLNCNHYSGSTVEQISRFIRDNNINVLCSGGMTMHIDLLSEAFKAARKINKDIINVAGGAIITSDPQFAMEYLGADFGVIGEGEETMAELAQALVLQSTVEKIKGITFFDESNNLIITEKRPPIKDLDAFPMPEYQGFDYDLYIKDIQSKVPYHFYTVFDRLDEVRPASILASRSCPYNCTFCYQPLGKPYRQRSLDKVFEEIDYLKNKYNINLLFLIDQLFSYDKQRMFDFAERIKAYGIKWIPQLRVNDVDLEVLRNLKESGVIAIGYGVESLSDPILKSMRKKITRAAIERALKLTREAKIAVVGNILLGDPEETEETIAETLSWWEQHPEYNINVRMIWPVPDSVIYRQAVGRGLIADKMQHVRDGFPPVNLTRLSDERFQELSAFTRSYAGEERYFIWGKILEVQDVSEGAGGIRFSLTVECPECREKCHYTPVPPQNGTSLLLLCKKCLMSFYVKTDALQQGQEISVKNYIVSKIKKYIKYCFNN